MPLYECLAERQGCAATPWGEEKTGSAARCLSRVSHTLVGKASSWLATRCAACGGRLFCAPLNASAVLVVDPARNTVSTIETGIAGKQKWSGIAECGGRLFCAPRKASGVLVVDIKGPLEELGL